MHIHTSALLKRAWIRLPLLVIPAIYLAAQIAPDASPLPYDNGAAGLWNALQKLHTRASLIMITAHPDDEDGGMLTWETRGQGARAILLTLTRGESGANVMSPDFFDALGLVRTEELLAADRYYGVEQYFSRAVNNGFSKTQEETYQSWSHDRVLADAVRIVRMTRPLIVTSVFIGGPSDGHGNHQVAGETAQEVFQAAGDPNIFPDQIKAGLRPWKPLKMYARVPRARVTDQGVYDYATHHWAPARIYDYVHREWLPWHISEDVRVPEGDVAPLLGFSYFQISRQGLGFQKSQNGGTSIPPADEMTVAYHKFGSYLPAGSSGEEASFFDGIDTSMEGIAELAGSSPPVFLKQALKNINSSVQAAMSGFRANEPTAIAPDLASGLKQTTALIAQVTSSDMDAAARYDVLQELRIKQRQFNAAIALALNLTLDAVVASDKADTAMAGFAEAADSGRFAIPGQSFRVAVQLNNASGVPIVVRDVRVQTPERERWTVEPEAAAAGPLATNKPKKLGFRVTPDPSAASTRPYFTRPNVEQGWYEIHDEGLLGQPFAPYPVTAYAELEYQGVQIRLDQIVQSVRHVNGQGSVKEPLIVAPAISVAPSRARGIIPIGSHEFDMPVDVGSSVKSPAVAKVYLELPHGWVAEPSSATFDSARDGDEKRIEFRVKPSRVSQQSYSIAAVAEYNNQTYRQGFRMTGYQGIRPYPIYSASTYRADGVDVKVAPSLNVAYVMGSGDDVPQSLESLGVHPKMLSTADLTSGDLSKFDVILIGVRAYAVRDDLKASNGRILQYVKNGGVVMVQYNTPEFDHNYGPYPYVMTNDPEEVTDETSKVMFVAPQNPVFNWPNKITEKDFGGWVSERGSKFLKSWDSRYEPLLETHDPDQDPQKGGFLYAKYGKGIYIYNAYAFYRQLPEGVPGAYRLMANFVSLAKNPGR